MWPILVSKNLDTSGRGSTFAPFTFHRSRLSGSRKSLAILFQVKRELLEAEPQSIILSSFLNPKAAGGKLLAVEVVGCGAF